MKNFITAIPLFDSKMTVHAYRMITRSGDKLLGAAEDFRMLGEALKTPELDLIEQISIEPFAGSCPLFADINKYQLLLGRPLNMNFSPNKLICVIDKDILFDDAVFPKLNQLKQSGFKLAVDGLSRGIQKEILAGIFNYILLDYKSEHFWSELKELRPYLFRIQIIIVNLPDRKNFNRLADIHGILLSGDFYSQPITEGISNISPIKVNALSLMNQVSDEDFDLIAAASVIERDPSLSISLLKFMNSAASGLHKKIDSIRGAVAILGQNEVRKWAAVAISAKLAEDRPGEITRLSLIRAKFAENLASAFNMGVLSGSLFLAGLFSLLDIILQRSMEEAVKEVSLDERVRDALVNGEGQIAEALRLIYAYERADWYKVSLNMVRNNVDVEVLNKAFLDALIWYKQLLESIDEDSEDEQGIGFHEKL